MNKTIRAALITGASTGLGAALARELGRNGARVVLTEKAVATRCSTFSVGFDPPDSRLAQVARGSPASFAICTWLSPRVERN